jgi:predicted acetyltransferase
VLGGIALRHGSSDYVLWAGHIGYGTSVRTIERGGVFEGIRDIRPRPALLDRALVNPVTG